jgi:hypothetical protein
MPPRSTTNLCGFFMVTFVLGLRGFREVYRGNVLLGGVRSKK